jgi:alkanesulfonate monooxygenase SsuD/methylene tetrahydromethanopterin reductase-like flavin-dependent oxidoreductase (luciferase family)
MVRRASPPAGVGLILPTFVQDTVPPWAATEPGDQRSDPVADLQTTCRRAEELGARALWTCDHLFWHGPCLEAMTTLAVAATATDRATLGTCVMQLPLRQAPAVAKQAATIQSLTLGRFVLGVGVGSHEGEYQQSGVDFHRRGQLLDAGISELRRCWESGRGNSRCDTDAVGPARYGQLPEPLPVPVWVGGSSETALRRAAGLADGWMPLFLSPAAYERAIERLIKEADRAGRPAGAVTPSMVLFVSVDDDPIRSRQRGTRWMSSMYGIPPKAFDRHLISGSPDEVAGVVAAFSEAGAHHVVVYVTEDNPLDQFERLMAALPATDVLTGV